MIAQPFPQLDEIARITDQLKRAFDGEAWHGDSVMEILADVDAKTAAARPIPGAHSIWEIVNHVSAWEEALRHRVLGEPKELEGEQDWPPVKDSSAAEWKKTVETLRKRHDALVQAVAALPDYKLLAAAPGRDHDYYHMLHGTVQHELYHAGQIALLKKIRK
ncbi:MAG TPA: DinB family protein [Terriglobales bacterium]|nr:DinB family protein [Terriglobales bacterium]